MLELGSFLVALAGLAIAYLTLRHTPKPPIPSSTPSCVMIERVKLPEPPSLPGYGRADCMGFNRPIFNDDWSIFATDSRDGRG